VVDFIEKLASLQYNSLVCYFLQCTLGNYTFVIYGGEEKNVRWFVREDFERNVDNHCGSSKGI